MDKKQAISVIVPTLNEAENMATLLARIDASLQQSNIPYEVVIIDDNSTDNTASIVETLTSTYPVRLSLKQGKRGKAYSLLQGFEEARNPLVAMIDADLQYPPEELVPMYDLMQDTNADVIVTRRIEKKVPFIRKVSTKVFNLIFARALFGIDFDTQSGLKLFKRHILGSFQMDPSPWSFDLEFLVRSLENKFKIVSHDIPFEERSFGVTKVKLLNTTLELVKASLQLRWRTSIRKTRAGYRENNRFLKSAFPMAMLLFVSTIAFIGASPQKANALAPSLAPISDTASILDPVISLFGGNNDNDNKPTTPTTAPTPTVTQPSGNTQVAATPAPAASTTSATPTQNSSATAPQNSSVRVTSASNSSNTSKKAVTTTVTPVSAKVTAAPTSDSTKLVAATGTDKDSIYASSYPNYTLSNRSTNRFSNIAQITWIAGILCLLAVILLISTTLMANYGTKILTRS